MLALAMSAAFMASCSSTPAESEAPASEASTESTTTDDAAESTEGGDLEGTLTYVSWNDNQRDQLEATIEGFNEMYPNVTIDLQFTPWSEYWTKLEAAATGGSLPDIITNHTIYAERYANAEMIIPLDDLASYNADFSFDNLPEGVTRLYRFNDTIYGVAKDIDCVVLAYNKEMFDNAGLSYPDDTWTWDDLEAAAEALTDKDNNMYGFAAYNNLQEAWGSFLYQNGGSVINEETNTSNLDSAESIEAMEFYMSLLDNYSPTTAQLAETDRRTMFASGNIGMLPTGNWQLNNFVDNEGIADKFNIAPLPAANDGTKATISNGLAYSVSAQSQNTEVAKAFVAYLGTQDANERAAIGVSIPAYNGVVDTWAEIHSADYNTQVITDSLAYGTQYVSTETRSLWEAELNVYLEQLFNGEIGVEEAFTGASAAMNEILATE